MEGVGKTSFAANAPKPIFMMVKGETGLETLIDSGRLGDVPHFPELNSFPEIISAIDWLADNEHDHKTLVIDTLNGAERLCHEHVCRRDYAGDWGEKGFGKFQDGFKVAVADWELLQAAIDRLREKKRMGFIGLCHTDIKNFKNPLGTDYDRFRPSLNEKTWNVCSRWADHILFANFHVEVAVDGPKAKKGKGLGGDKRYMQVTRTAAWDAKNRCGLTDEIDMGDSGAEAWGNFIEAIKAGKEQK